MKKNGYTIVELAIVLGVFGIAFFVATGSISNVFNFDYKSDLYSVTVDAIEKQAAIYGKLNPELFSEEDVIYVTIDELAKANVVVSYEDGKVIDPRDESRDLNNLRVKISKESEDSIVAKILV